MKFVEDSVAGLTSMYLEGESGCTFWCLGFGRRVGGVACVEFRFGFNAVQPWHVERSFRTCGFVCGSAAQMSHVFLIWCHSLRVRSVLKPVSRRAGFAVLTKVKDAICLKSTSGNL